MNGLYTGATGKALALSIGFLGLGIVYLTAIAPLLALYQSQTQEIQRRAERAEHLRHAADGLPQLRAEAERLAQKNRDAGDLLLTEPSDALAAATIQSKVKTFVMADGGSVTSVDTLPSQPVNGMRRITIRVAFSTSLSLLAHVLQKVETSRPALFVDNFDLRVGSSADGGDPSPQLSVALDIYGFRS